MAVTAEDESFRLAFDVCENNPEDVETSAAALVVGFEGGEVVESELILLKFKIGVKEPDVSEAVEVRLAVSDVYSIDVTVVT